MLKCWIIGGLLVLSAGAAVAETRYVTDQVLVALRPAQDDSAEVLERLPTGAAVEVLEDLGAFLKVKSAAGNSGYVRARYFIPTPPKAGKGASAAVLEELAAERRKNSELASEVERLKAAPSVAAPPPESEAVKKELTEVSAKYQQLLQSSNDLPAILRDRDQLKAETVKLAAEVERLRNQPSPGAGTNGSAIQWFLAGGGVFLVGWLAGKSSRQKRRYA